MAKKKDSNATEERSSIVVMIEWDGKTPPATFYNRLHDYGLYSRRSRFQTKDEILESGVSLYEWRASQDGKKKNSQTRGIVLQEGMIQCSTASMAAAIKQIAINMNAKHVVVGNFISSDITMSEKDLAQFMAIETKVSKRGPKARLEQGRYTVTCFDEAMTFEVESDSIPTHCPNCSSVKNDVRLGKQISFSWDFSSPYNNFIEDTACEDIFSYWVRTRLSTGKFEVPMIYDDKVHPLPFRHVGDEIEQVPQHIVSFFYYLMKEKDGNIPNIITDMIDTPRSVLKLVDDIYCAGLKSLAERKLERRRVIGDYLNLDGSNYWELQVPDDLDMVDLVQIDRETYFKYL